MEFRILTAGKSHAECLTAVIDGGRPGLAPTEDRLDADLARRQGRDSRGGRTEIERDHAYACLDEFGGDGAAEIRESHDAHLGSLKTR